MSKFTERRCLLSVVISIMFVSMIALSCGGGGGSDSLPSQNDSTPTESILFGSKPTLVPIPEKVSVFIATNGRRTLIADKQIVVTFRDGFTLSDEKDFIEIIEKLQLKIIGQLPTFDILILESRSNDDIVMALDDIRELPYILEASPNKALTLYNNELYPVPYPFPSGGDEWIQWINAPKAWHLLMEKDQFFGENVPIGIVDDGLENYGNHFDENRITILDEDVNHATSPHGIHVACIAAADGFDEKGICGLAWNSPILSYDAFQFDDQGQQIGFITTIYRGIELAVFAGARVINISMGVGSFSFRTGILNANEVRYNLQDFRRSMNKAAKFAYDNDCLLIWAQGNNSSLAGYSIFDDNDLFPEDIGELYYEIEIEMYTKCWKENSIIVTSAIDSTTIGTHIRGTVTDIAAPIKNIYKAERFGEASQTFEGEGGGTSSAAPQVTGAAALIWSLNPNLNAKTVKQILIENGQGSNAIPILDVYAALLDDRIGYDPDDGSNEIIPYPYDNSYYPLAVGLKWKFSDGSTMEIVGTEYINGYLCFVREEKSSDFYSGVNDFYVKRYLHKDGNNVYVIAMVFAFIDGRPDSWLRINNPVYPLHKEPFYVGASWTKGMSVDPFVDRWIDDKWYDVYWDISYEVVSDTETVSIRNGELNDCLELRTTSTDLYINQDDSTDRFFKYSNSYYFRARGIGPVRSIEQNGFTGETSEYNLVSFTFN